MPKLPLTFACGLYDRMLALHTGEVQVEGVDLNFLVDDNPRNIFDRMAAAQEFDAAEFSSSEYVSRFVADQCPFVAIPVFASRVFRHSFIFINKKHVKSPEGARGQAHRRAGLHHDGGDLHPRAAERRARHRLFQLRMGRGRHQQRQGARQSDHPADREEAFDQRQQVRQVAEQDAGGRRACRPSSAPACRRRSAATPISCGSIRTIARPRWNTTSAPRSSRSCTPW